MSGIGQARRAQGTLSDCIEQVFSEMDKADKDVVRLLSKTHKHAVDGQVNSLQIKATSARDPTAPALLAAAARWKVSSLGLRACSLRQVKHCLSSFGNVMELHLYACKDLSLRGRQGPSFRRP